MELACSPQRTNWPLFRKLQAETNQSSSQQRKMPQPQQLNQEVVQISQLQSRAKKRPVHPQQVCQKPRERRLMKSLRTNSWQAQKTTASTHTFLKTACLPESRILIRTPQVLQAGQQMKKPMAQTKISHSHSGMKPKKQLLEQIPRKPLSLSKDSRSTSQTEPARQWQ